MDLYVITVLRLVHIFAGVFWAGAALTLAGFIEPAVKAAGPEGGKFMQRVVQGTPLPLVMTLSSLLATITGAVLYWFFSGGLQPSWVASRAGLSFTIGSAAGILAVLLGSFLIGPTAKQLGELGKRMQVVDGPGAAAYVPQLVALQDRLALTSRISAVLLIISVIGMALARYI